MEKDISVSLLKELHKKDYSVEDFKTYLNKHRDVDLNQISYKKTGDKILHIIARIGNVPLLNHLLTLNLDVNCKNLDYKTPLHEACQFVQYETVRILIDNGSDVNALKKSDWTPLMLACTKTGENALKTIEYLCEHEAFVNVKNKDGWTALHLSCREGDLDIVEYLIKRYKTVDTKTKNGRTVLHIAALHGHYDIVKRLLEMIDPNVRDNCGNTLLHEATCGDKIEIVKLLTGNGSVVDATNDFGFNILHISASEGYVQLLNHLIVDLKLDVDSKTKLSYTPLHCAARKKQFEVIEILKNHGADETIRDIHKRCYNDYLKL